MDSEGIMARLNEVFREAFMDDSVGVTPETTAADIPGWDSMMHVTLVVAIEEAFGVHFTSREVGAFRNVGDVAALLSEKLASS